MPVHDRLQGPTLENRSVQRSKFRSTHGPRVPSGLLSLTVWVLELGRFPFTTAWPCKRWQAYPRLRALQLLLFYMQPWYRHAPE